MGKIPSIYVSDESLKNYKDYVYEKEVKRWYAEKIANHSTWHQQQEEEEQGSSWSRSRGRCQSSIRRRSTTFWIKACRRQKQG